MPSIAREVPLDRSNAPSLYSKAELVELRRHILLFARSCPPGFERNQHRQVAQSLGRLFKNAKWLDSHTLEGSGLRQNTGLPRTVEMQRLTA